MTERAASLKDLRRRRAAWAAELGGTGIYAKDAAAVIAMLDEQIARRMKRL
jgi:hypothetical protein